MRIVGLSEIKAALDWDDAIAAIAVGFREFSKGRVALGAVGHLGFSAASGDCHVKSASMEGAPWFAVKVATGFYRNPERGLPTSNGFMVLLDAETGQPACILMDEGWLTDMRTAMAGSIAAKSILPRRRGPIGIVGAGIQARLHAKMIAHVTGITEIMIWARNPAKAQALCIELGRYGLRPFVTDDLYELCSRSVLTVTTTPAQKPLLFSQMFQGGARIIAVGADTPGKQELDSALVASSDVVIVDSKSQCLDHGEAGWPGRSGLLDETRIVELGDILSSGAQFSESAKVVVDLTGLGIQDLQIAQSVWQRLK